MSEAAGGDRMTDQPTGARYPAVVALLRRERERAEDDAAHFEGRVMVCEETLYVIRMRKPRQNDAAEGTWWERNAAQYRDLIEQRESLVRQIDAALARLEGATDDTG